MAQSNFYRLRDISDTGDALADLRAACAVLRDNPGSTLTIDPGVYLLRDEAAAKLQRDVMNGVYGANPEPSLFHPAFDYAVGLDFDGVRGATVVADGVKFIVDGFMETVSLRHCSDVTIRGLTIDLRRRSFTEGEITAAGEDWIDVRVYDKYRELLTDKSPAPRLILTDVENNRIVHVCGCSGISFDGETARFRGVTLRIKSDAGLSGIVGYRLTAVHCFHFRPQILVWDAVNTVLEDVTLHNSCGMGIVGHRSRDITLNRLNVVPDEPSLYGGAGGMSTSTDATHFTSCSGKISFTDCVFEGNGDDCTNVHTYYQTVSDTDGARCVSTINAPTGTHCQKLDPPSPGDVLQYIDSVNLLPLAEFTVVESAELPPDESLGLPGWFRTSLTLDRPLPEGADGNYFINKTRRPALDFIRCRSKNHLARAVLVKTPDTRIIGCRFDGSSGTAVHIGAEGWWHEGGASENVTVRDCEIVNCGEQGVGTIRGAGAVAISADARNPNSPIHKNIVIANNKISCKTKCAVYAENAENVEIKNNGKIEVMVNAGNSRGIVVSC